MSYILYVLYLDITKYGKCLLGSRKRDLMKMVKSYEGIDEENTSLVPFFGDENFMFINFSFSMKVKTDWYNIFLLVK